MVVNTSNRDEQMYSDSIITQETVLVQDIAAIGLTTYTSAIVQRQTIARQRDSHYDTIQSDIIGVKESKLGTNENQFQSTDQYKADTTILGKDR